MISLRTWARQLAAGGVLRYGYLLAGTKIPQTTKVNCDIGYGNLPLWGSRKKIWRRLQMDLNSRASRKKLMVQRRCHARIYKGIAAASVTFRGKRATAAQATDFLLHKKAGTSFTCSGVVRDKGLEPTRIVENSMVFWHYVAFRVAYIIYRNFSKHKTLANLQCYI